jgi:hypothetical protein
MRELITAVCSAIALALVTVLAVLWRADCWLPRHTACATPAPTECRGPLGGQPLQERMR